MTRKIRVLAIDDSALTRRIITDALSSEPDIEVVGTAPDPIIAEDKITSLKPDVLTLDLEMPRMDGLSFLKKLMGERPMPVVIISSLAQAGCAAALHAMEAGAVEVLAKPAGKLQIEELRISLPQKIRAAASARLGSPRRAILPASASPKPKSASLIPRDKPRGLILLGASTGGTDALRDVLEKMPPNSPPVLVVQHIPPVFSKAFAQRLDRTCAMEVREAVDGDKVENGLALIAPGDQHMVLKQTGTGLQVRLKDGPRVCYQRPAVDVLFLSAAEIIGYQKVAALLTGMGADGAQGMLKLRSSGTMTIAQDEKSCVVYGMPREAVKLGAASQILPLNRIADAICQVFPSPVPRSYAELTGAKYTQTA